MLDVPDGDTPRPRGISRAAHRDTAVRGFGINSNLSSQMSHLGVAFKFANLLGTCAFPVESKWGSPSPEGI